MLKREDFHEYQDKAVRFVKDTGKCGLFLEMGLGKTAIALTAASDYISMGIINKVLIVAPLRVANSVWKQEAEKWEHLEHLNIEICTGSLAKRKKALARDADIYVINRENLVWLVENQHPKFEMTIIDESSSFKSAKTKRFKACKKLIKYQKSVVLLSGTPAPESLLDLWSQIYLIDEGERLGKSIFGYRDYFFVPRGYRGYVWEPKEASEQQIKNRIKDICLSMQSEDYIKLPEKIEMEEKVKLPDKAKKQYREIEKEFVLSIDEQDIEVSSSVVLANKLLQISNGTIYDNEHKTILLHDAKIDALKEIVEENQGENFLIAYNFKADLLRLSDAFPDAKILKSDADVVEWNQGKIPILLAHPQSSAYGLNLQSGGSVVVWFGLCWSLELYQQFNARIHRQGQEKPVRIIHVVAEDCIDERVMSALKSKAKNQHQLMTHLKHSYT